MSQTRCPVCGGRWDVGSEIFVKKEDRCTCKRDWLDAVLKYGSAPGGIFRSGLGLIDDILKDAIKNSQQK